MGKTECLPPVGNAELKLTSTRLVPGDTLRGVVRLQLEQALDHAMISVKITGTERLQWVNVAQSFDKRYHIKIHQHIDEELFLGHPNTSLPAGRHEFPFEFELPSDLITNASRKSIHRLFIYDMRDVFVDFVYKVTATVESAGLTNNQLQQQVESFIKAMPTAVPSHRLRLP